LQSIGLAMAPLKTRSIISKASDMKSSLAVLTCLNGTAGRQKHGTRQVTLNLYYQRAKRRTIMASRWLDRRRDD
jgi:hypothetical protein